MKRITTFILAAVIALVFFMYMITFTVGYNETAIKTRFNRAVEPDAAALANGEDSGSVYQTPGLRFKLPWPIESVRTYPTQLQVLADTAEQIQLADRTTVVMNLNLTWRIEDPLAFFRSLGTLEEAEDKLLGQLRDLKSVISSEYSMEDLVNTDASAIRLDELEEALASTLRSNLSQIEPSYGIEVAEVTIGRMLYHQSTVQSVNDRMATTQETRAQEIRSSGTSDARDIISDAESIRDQLTAFANNVGSQIELIGEREANEILERYRFLEEGGSDEGLAIYLRQLEALREILANRTTFVLDARTFSPLDVFVYGHGGPGDLPRLQAFQAPLNGGQPTVSVPTPLSQEAGESLEQEMQRIEDQIQALQERFEAIQRERQTQTPLRPGTQQTRTEAGQ